jgi:hypothetical protein
MFQVICELIIVGKEEERTPFLRKLFLEISNSNLRVVLHNGFIDLIFLYQVLSNLYYAVSILISALIFVYLSF